MALKKYTFHIGILTYSRFLNQRKRENDRRKYFMTNLHEECRTGRGSNRDLLITSWTRIRPSHQRRSLNPDTVLSTHNSGLMLVLQSIHLHLLPTLLSASFFFFVVVVVLVVVVVVQHLDLGCSQKNQSNLDWLQSPVI